TDWQLNTRILQRAKIGPFLHPHFTGKNAPRQWRGIQCSHFDRGTNVQVLNDKEQQVYEELRRLYRENDSCRDVDRMHADIAPILKDWQFEAKYGYAWTTLANLDIVQQDKFVNDY